MSKHYNQLLNTLAEEKKTLAILIDPEKFDCTECATFLKNLPSQTTHLFVGGSTVPLGQTEATTTALKKHTTIPIFLFPGDFSQITETADSLLFLSLLSGRNAEFLIGQQVKATALLKKSELEIIPTGYLLIDGGHDSAVAKVSNTLPMSQDNIEAIVNTALTGQLMGAKLIYLEAGSGARMSVRPEIVSEVKKVLNIPLIVGGGIKTETQKQLMYQAGADMVVMGTAFEKSST